MSAEMITIFHENDLETPIYINRKEFRSKREDYHDHYLYLIDLFIFNSHGELYLQKRSRAKTKNPLKLHTSVGGHINAGESAEFTVLHECIEEMGAPCHIEKDEQKFAAGLAKLQPYLNKFIYIRGAKGYLRNINQETPSGPAYFKDRMFLGFGLYDGPIQNMDRDAAGFELISLTDLEQELEKNPLTFTENFHTYFAELKDDMKNFVGKYCIHAI